MATSSRSGTAARHKRPRSPAKYVAIPPEDCTRFTFDQHANLNDRQILCWALQTEARVRFGKLEQRDDPFAGDTTLNSEYLLELYPEINVEEVERELAHEKHAYARKSLLYLQSMREPDSSFDSLTQLTFDRPRSTDLRRKPEKKGPKCLPIPPNLLYFEIVLVAYMGYVVPSYHSTDNAQPRAAVMGGAVVATLTSWRDKHILSMFKRYEKELLKALETDDEETFRSTREQLRQTVHRYFLHETERWGRPTPSNSPFSMGDVDIFLQTSPLTRSLLEKMSILPVEVREQICGFLGDGCLYVHRDLHDFASNLCDNHLIRQFRYAGARYDERWDRWDGEKQLFYALTANGISFAFVTKEEEESNLFDPEKDTWPRTTQLIMLNEKADIVGGLMDFDTSLVSCAYDGVNVYATPRAAFSLKTMSQVVTPFVYEEKRNRSRISKYYSRGFDAYILDPFCSHENQCFDKEKVLKRIPDANDSEKDEALESNLIKSAEESSIVTLEADWRVHELTSDDMFEEICEEQREDEMTGVFVCRSGCRFTSYRGSIYSVALFEKSEGHGMEFFAKRDNWSEEQKREMMEIPEHRRLACCHCRKAYGLSLVLDKAPSALASVGMVEDVLHGEWSYRHTRGFNGDFEPSFYSGGSFSSYSVGTNARSFREQLGVMRSQQRIEEARYLRLHGTMKGYQERFLYGGELKTLFEDAAIKSLPRNGRAPVGLNPERFVAKCKACNRWLHEREFGVEYCDICMESKPTATDD